MHSSKNVLISLIIVATVFDVFLNSCKKDPAAFVIDSVLIGVIDVNSSEPTTNVPVHPVIVTTFNSNVDSITADPANISLVQDYDKSVIPITVISSGKTISITPTEDLGWGILYELTFKAGLKSIDGLSLAEETRRFTTIGTFAPKGAVAYWNFEDNANDQIGTYNPTARGVVDITYALSRNMDAGKAATFNGSTSIIEVPHGDILMNSPDFTLSFWVKTNSSDHVDADQKPAGYFVIGLAAFFGFEFEITADFGSCNFVASYDIGEGKTVSEDLLFLGDGKDKDHGGWQGWEFCKDLNGYGGVAGLLKDQWTFIVCMFEAATKRGTIYINGEKMKVSNFNLWPEGNDRRKITGLKFSGVAPETYNELAFGFIQSRAGTFYEYDPRYGYEILTSNHFKGQLDDIRIFHKALTATEILLMYNSGK
jgi:hypothetical protein